jgi:hypothetical protein
MALWLTLFFTFVIALATIAYVFLTGQLWRETKKTAEAAILSAQAAQASAAATAGLYRPFVGLVTTPHVNDPNASWWRISFALRNFGSTPAVHVKANCELIIGVERIYTKEDPQSAEIFPNSSHEVVIATDLGLPVVRRFTGGSEPLFLKVRVEYGSADGKRFEYVAQAKLIDSSRYFSILNSETRSL